MLKEKLEYALETFDGEAADLIAGLYELTGDLEYALDIIKSEGWFNFYTYIDSYEELASSLVGDDCLWEDGKDEFYDFLMGDHTEGEYRKRLLTHGWYVTPSGLAIGLDDEVAIEVIKRSLITGNLKIDVVRAMQDFMDMIALMKKMPPLDITKDKALELLSKENYEPEAHFITRVAIDRYFESPKAYKLYERDFFLKQIPLEEAKKLFSSGKEEVFALYDDGSEGIIDNQEDFDNTDVYGVEYKY